MLAVPLCVADLRQTLADLGDGCRCVCRPEADLIQTWETDAGVYRAAPLCVAELRQTWTNLGDGCRCVQAAWVLAPLLRFSRVCSPLCYVRFLFAYLGMSSISELAPARHGQSLL